MVNVVDQTTQQTSISPSIRHATRSRVSDMLQKKLEGKLDNVSKERFDGLIKMIDDKLMEMAKYSESRYSDLVDLDNRVKCIWNEFHKSVSRKHACPPTSSNTVNNLPNAASLQSGRSIAPTTCTNEGGSTFNGNQQVSAGFAIGSGGNGFNRTSNNLPNAAFQSGSIPPTNYTNAEGSLGNESQRVSAGFSFGSGDNGFNRTANNLPNSTLQSGSIPPTNYTNGGSSFSGIQQVSAGFPNNSGLYKTANIDQSLYTDGIRVSAIGSDLQRHQTPGANVQMVDVYRSNNIHQNQTTTGFGMSRNNTVPRATTPVTSEELFSSTPLLHLSNPMLQPFGQLHAAPPLHRYSMSNADSFNSSSLDAFVTSSPVLAQNPNHMPLRGDATFTSNQTNLQGMQQALFPGHQFGNNGFQSTSTNKENLAHVSQQLLDRGLHQGQCSQQFYPGQLQKKQDHLLYEDTYRTQFATGLATPVKHGLSLEDYKEALQKQNGFRPSNFQYQQNAVKDQYTSAQSSSSVHNSQLNSSPSIRSHPPQKQSASVQVHSSVQKAHQKQPASVQAQTQSSLKKKGRRQKQPASVQAQTLSSQQKPHPPQKQSESVLVQTQSSVEKPHQKQLETAMVQTQSSLQKLHPPQKQSESVLIQTQSSLEKTHQKQPESVPSQMQLSQQKPHPHQKQPTSVQVQTQSKPDPPQKQSASVVVQTQSSLQKLHLPQKQPESVLVQTQASVQKQTQISENNNGEREQIGVNLCQRTPMQPEALNRGSSAKPPRNHQTVSPTRTAKRKRLPYGNTTSSRVVKGDNGRIERYRRWILLMSHVCCCTAPKGKCESICFRAKETLKHAQHCKVPNCTYPNCLLTRESQHHFKQCRDKSCCVCVYVKNFKKKHREASLRAAKPRFSSLQGRPRESSEFRQAYNKEVTEAPSVVDDLQPSVKRLKIKQPSQNATPQTESNSVSVYGVVCKSHSSMDVQAKKGLLSDDCKSVKVEVKPMDIYVSDASGIPVTKEVEKHVVEDTPKGKNGGEVKPMAIDVSNASGIPVTRDVEKHVVEFTPKGKNGGEAMPMAIDVSDASRIPVTQEVEKHVVEFTPKGKNGGEVKPMEIDVSNASGIPVTREVEKHVVEDTSKGKNGGEVKPMAIDVSDASGIPVTREVEMHVVEDTPKGKKGGEVATDSKTVCVSGQGKSQCMNEMIASKEENVKQSADASKMEISSLIELFTPYQVREHISGLRQWIGQSKSKADKYKAMSNEPLTENSCQLCAVQTLVFDPVPIYCTPCNVRIKRNASLYTVMAGETWHYVCVPCYNDARVKSVSIQGTLIPKASFEKKKNDDPAEEAWVQCDKCQSWQHQICALFNIRTNHGEATKYTCPRCYIKEVEKGERRPLSQNAIPGAISLPVTSLSNHLEQRLLKNLKKERQERARFQGKSYEEVPGAESLVVRVVASVDKVLEVNECFRELFREENYPSEFPYKSKVILLFQKIESVEVCLFGMFVQEFGTNSGPPNQRRVYISYLDSVKYFQPEVRTVSREALRTFVYHEILIGYLDYCKKRGFTSCYIWACPPVKGDDYILYCHPEIQKMPKNDKLRDWYLAMLRKAAKEDVVVECTNLYDQFFVQSEECRANVTAARLPYFNGDCWPGIAAELLTQKSHEDDGTKLNRKGFTKNVISKRALKAVGQSDLSVNASKDRVMMRKLGESLFSTKEDFIMIHLQHCCKHCCTLMISGNRWVCNQCKNFHICDNCYEAEQNRGDKERHPVNQKEKHTLFPVPIKDVPIEIEDKDANIESEFFDTREVFLNLCKRNNYQYDTLRRAKHSSMMLLYHLHNPTAPAFATICTICQQEVDNTQGWRCGVCPSFDVCNACYSKAPIEHPHNLISRSSTSDTVVQQSGKTNNQIQFEKMKQLLIHAPTCRTPQCQYPYCRNMLSLMRHCTVCKIGSLLCTHCKKFRDLIQQHSCFCRDSQCTVYKCRSFKAERSRTQEQSDKRRRAAVMKMMRERAAEATHTS